MSNFLKFIEEDIEAKKTLLSTMPTRTKKDIKNFNEKVISISDKYQEYKSSVKIYIETKSRSFEIKKNRDNIDELTQKLNNLERVRFVLNPLNTYVEKMGFDNLIYQINNYYDFNFSSLNELINQFLAKFELADINLQATDFEYTCYVHEYMTVFLKARNEKESDYNGVSEIFEKIYWLNPDIIQHIELNFRKLIKKHEKKFIHYISKYQDEILEENGIKNYQDCLEKLRLVYIKLNVEDKENITDIINLAKAGNIDMNSYFKDSKIRNSTYSSLTIDSLNFEDKLSMDRFYENLRKLRCSVEEYDNYLKFVPFMDEFKKEYASLIPEPVKSFKLSNKEKPALKSIIVEIESKEDALEKINKEIFSGKTSLFSFGNNENDIKQLKVASIKKAKELYELYKKYDTEYFKDKVLTLLNTSMTISEMLHLYYSFDYFKKNTIKKVFNITNYEDIIKYSNEFDLFAMNPTNMIIDGITLFDENNISKIIMNKYRLDNINIVEDNLNSSDLRSLLDKIQLLLRIQEIEKSSTTVEKIWFMAQIEKNNRKENKAKTS